MSSNNSDSEFDLMDSDYAIPDNSTDEDYVPPKYETEPKEDTYQMELSDNENEDGFEEIVVQNYIKNSFSEENLEENQEDEDEQDEGKEIAESKKKGKKKRSQSEKKKESAEEEEIIKGM